MSQMQKHNLVFRGLIVPSSSGNALKRCLALLADLLPREQPATTIGAPEMVAGAVTCI
jgi:hypothetical protein